MTKPEPFNFDHFTLAFYLQHYEVIQTLNIISEGKIEISNEGGGEDNDYQFKEFNPFVSQSGRHTFGNWNIVVLAYWNVSFNFQKLKRSINPWTSLFSTTDSQSFFANWAFMKSYWLLCVGVGLERWYDVELLLILTLSMSPGRLPVNAGLGAAF